jgi:hypothetical protein
VWFTFLIANKLDGETKQDDYVASLTELSICLIQKEVNPEEYASIDCGVTPKVRPSYGLEIGLVFIVPGLGLFAIGVYGFNITLYQKWKAFFLNNCRVSQAQERGSMYGESSVPTASSQLGRAGSGVGRKNEGAAGGEVRPPSSVGMQFSTAASSPPVSGENSSRNLI